MYRRAYVLLIGVASTMGLLSIIAALSLDKRLADPDGFLGPAWVRLPMLLVGAFLMDMLPRVVSSARAGPGHLREVVRERIAEHWTRERLTLVVLGVVCFYITYVSYRNLKSFLPFVIEKKYDRELHLLDKACLLYTSPSPRD